MAIEVGAGLEFNYLLPGAHKQSNHENPCYDMGCLRVSGLVGAMFGFKKSNACSSGEYEASKNICKTCPKVRKKDNSYQCFCFGSDSS